MTGRERVMRALEFDTPDRVPRDLWTLKASELAHGKETIARFRERWPLDIVQCLAGKPEPPVPRDVPLGPGETCDEWGCVFTTLREGILGEVKRPLVDDWSKLELVRPPVELLDVDVEAADAFSRADDHFVLASGWARPFERIQFLRGTENVFMDLAEESAELMHLIGIVHGFYLKQMEIWAGTAADALVIMDDWGAQRSLLIRPDVWRRLFRPLYADYGAVARAHGKKLFMHSDGHIAEIYEDLVEVGIDAVNSQLFCMDMEDLGRRVAGRIAFWGEIDRQQVLARGTPGDVRRAVEKVVRLLWRPEGGCIAQFSLGEDTPMENAEAVFRAWEELTGPRPT